MAYEFNLLRENQNEEKAEIEKPKDALQREADTAEQILNQAKRVYKQYQEDSIQTSQIRAEILKGVQADEDIYQLFLKASLAISLMVHNDMFYRQIAEQIEKKHNITME